jgi:hypothetical protein
VPACCPAAKETWHLQSAGRRTAARGPSRRFAFKQEIAQLGSGDADKLLAAYKKNFEVWREGSELHIRYGSVSKQCYCPAARYHPVKPHDMHCERTRATHQTSWIAAPSGRGRTTIRPRRFCSGGRLEVSDSRPLR